MTITPAKQVAADITPSPTGVGEPTDTPSESPSSASSQPSGLPSPTHKPKPTPSPTVPLTTVDPNDPACSDDAYNLEGFAWNTVYRWHYNADSTPAGYDADAVLAVIKTGFQNIVDENNDCGRPDNIHAFEQYQGKTTLTPCTDQPDGQNTIGWGEIPSDLSADTIAYTCPFRSGPDGSIAYEADIVISDQMTWALSASDCFFDELLEPTITHEAGHVFGLGHVSERQHPDLTMSTASNGPCNNVESTLGLGDMLGLEKLYPGS